MIRVTVELVSAVDPSRDRVLGVAHIVNRGPSSGSPPGRFHNYEVRLSKWAPKERETWRKKPVDLEEEWARDVLGGQVGAFDRVKRGAWDLLYLALKATVGDRNGG